MRDVEELTIGVKKTYKGKEENKRRGKIAKRNSTLAKVI